jgi:transposase-like protein
MAKKTDELQPRFTRHMTLSEFEVLSSDENVSKKCLPLYLAEFQFRFNNCQRRTSSARR